MDLLVATPEDQASQTLREVVLAELDLERAGENLHVADDVGLLDIDDLHLYHDDVDRDVDLDVDRVVFLSRHQSEAGVPSLTVHPIGNFGEAKYGGEPETLVPAPVDLIAPMLRGLAERVPDRYEATLEATHHGPHLQTPACFVEIGSDEQAWKDRQAGEAVVGALLDALDAEPQGPVTVGIGGGHYMPRLTDVARKYDVGLGHMLADYHLGAGVDDALVDRLVDATPDVEAAYLDRGSLGNAQIAEAESAFEERGVDVVRSGDLDPVG